MVEALLKHGNARDFNGITKEQRRANLHRWVVKEKDACNKKLKEGRVPTSLPASLITKLPKAQPMQESAKSSIMAMPPQRLQMQPATLAPAVGQALECSTASSRLGSPGLSSATATSRAVFPIAAPPLPYDLSSVSANDRYPVDSRLPDLDVENSDSYDFDLGIERGTGAARDTLDHANMWSFLGLVATDLPHNGRTNNGKTNAAEADSSQLEGLEYDPKLEALLNTTWN
ncbi:MAG: hypothetical protein Q9164_007379 [Protoblastenia rupestris]